MPNDAHDDAAVDPQEALRLLDEARSRIRMVIWALHGMHQDMSVLTSDDLSDAEHILTEILENALNPGVDALADLLGMEQSEAVTHH
jgi:hypothetical protein